MLNSRPLLPHRGWGRPACDGAHPSLRPRPGTSQQRFGVLGGDYLPFIIPIKSIKNTASSPIELYSKPSHFADLCRHAKYAHLNYIFSPDGACWHAAGPPRRVRACAKTVSTGRPAYGRPAGYHHEHTRLVPGLGRRLGCALSHAGHPHPLWGSRGLEFSTGPP